MIDLLGEIKAIRGIISFQGVATANGGAGGINLICSDLTLRPDYDGNLVIITSGAYIGQARDINGVTNLGTVTPHAAFGGQIVAGTEFLIVAIRTTPAEVAALTALVVALTANVATLTANVADVETKLDLVIVPGVFTYLDAGGEQVVFTYIPLRETRLNTIWLDLVNLTQNTDIRVYHQIDGANYRVFETFNWTVGMDDGVYFRNIALAVGRNLQLTIQETADEGADRDIPFYHAYEPR